MWGTLAAMQTFTEQEIMRAALAADVPVELRSRLQEALRNSRGNEARFEGSHIAYYFGGLLICGAMGWFITQAWDRLPGVMLTAIAVLYAVLFGGVGYWLSRRAATRVPGGVLVTVAVCMTPLAVYGIERQIGWWPAGDPVGYANFHPLINGSWVLLEALTILASGVALRAVRFPFITAPAAYALWYLSMDLPRLVTGHTFTFHQQCWISVVFGLVMMGVGYVADGEAEQDVAFWFYLFGLLTFSGGLVVMGDGTQLGRAAFCAVHLLLMILSIVLQRRAFLVFGALGVAGYLAEEAQRYFKDSLSFSLALTVLGVLLIVAGLLYKRHEADLAERFARWIPHRVRHRHAAQTHAHTP